MPVRKGVDPKPDGQTWSQGRKAAESARGYAPAPRGGTKPVQLGTTRGANAYTRVWRPGFGWKPKFVQAGNTIKGARAVDIAGGNVLKEALRATNKTSMGPLSFGGGGGGDLRSQKKK